VVPPTPAATITKPPPPRPETPARAQPAATPTPPATGRQISAGDSKVETGARTESQGLSSSAGGGLQSDLDATFCCPEWAAMMKLVIEREWNDSSRVRATTILTFTVQRDGRVTDVAVDRSSGDRMLDVEARRTMLTVKLPPLPAEYQFETLKVRLRFPYGGGW
jgi:TonB family protein